MLLFKQLDLFERAHFIAPSPVPPKHGRDAALEARAHELLHSLGATAIAASVRVEWSSRLRTAAGRADSSRKLITLNPRLCQHGEREIERTFLHELAHLLAQSRAGRRRIAPHGVQWRQACADLGIGDEQRCHSLPFPVRRRTRRFLYRCPSCAADFPRVRRVRRRVACLACCRRYCRGQFDARFQLQLVSASAVA
ncbi:MAG TPA: SprT-like domain-containing protein [Chthoniobacterales bacterium]